MGFLNSTDDKKSSYYWEWKGFNIFWQIEGEENKSPMILIHGFGASSKHWRKNSTYFAKKGFSVYCLDLIGFGNSAQPGIKEIGKIDNGVWCNQIKDFIEQVIRPKNLKKVILVGNSLGALVSLTCAVYIEDEILAVIASPLPDQILSKKTQLKSNIIFEKVKNRFIKLFFNFFPLEIILFLVNKLGFINAGLNSAYFKKDKINKELIEIIRKPVLRKTAARALRAMCIGMATRGHKLKSTYLLNKLSNSQKIPFLLIWGDKDNFIPLFIGKKIANLFRWVKLVIVSNSGHCVHDEDPSIFNKISYEWIRDLNLIKK